MGRDVAKSQHQQFHCLKEILSLAEISTEHKYLRLILKFRSPKESAGFRSEPVEVFLSYILGYGDTIFIKLNQ